MGLYFDTAFMYKKCFHKKVKVCFGKRFADCCGDTNVLESSLSIVENGLVLGARRDC